MARDSGEQGACSLAGELAHERIRRKDGVAAEVRYENRVTWEMDGRKDVGKEHLPLPDKRRHEAAVSFTIGVKIVCRFVDGPVCENGGPILKRMAQGKGGMNPLQAVSGEGQCPKVWGSDAERMNRGADIMKKPRESQLCGSRAASGCVARLKDAYRAAGAG